MVLTRFALSSLVHLIHVPRFQKFIFSRSSSEPKVICVTPVREDRRDAAKDSPEYLLCMKLAGA